MMCIYLQVGNWSRCLNDMFGIGADQSAKDDQNSIEDDEKRVGDETSSFDLLNALSDLLMLPKDMLIDRTIRMEVQLFLFLCRNIEITFILPFFSTYSFVLFYVGLSTDKSSTG